MSKLQLSIVGVIVLGSLAVAVVVEHQAQVKLREKDLSLQQQLERVTWLSTENQRLTDSLAQAKTIQDSANHQLEELLRLRGEVARLRQEHPTSKVADRDRAAPVSPGNQSREVLKLQAELSRLRQENQELEKLRAEIQQSRVAAAESSSTPDTGSPAQTEEAPAQVLSIRVIKTQGDTFAEKLKRSVIAQEGETFQQVFRRFLEANGIQSNSVATALFDERTGRVIVRADQTVLDLIEKATLALDQAP